MTSSFAEGKGYDLSKYETLATKEGPVWKVEFYAKGNKPGPGDFFSVYLDENTKSNLRLVPGK